MRIAICEDDVGTLESLTNLTRNYLGSTAIIYSFSSLADLDRIRDEVEFELYLLDIGLADGNGFEYAKSIRATNKRCRIAFITSHDEFSVEGYQYAFNGYLVKPIDNEKLKSMLERFKEEITISLTPVMIKENYRNVPIYEEDILCIEKLDRKTRIVTKLDVYETNESLRSLIERIGRKSLYAVNRSLAINAENIVRFQPSDPIAVLLFEHTILLTETEFLDLNEYILQRKGLNQ